VKSTKDCGVSYGWFGFFEASTFRPNLGAKSQKKANQKKNGERMVKREECLCAQFKYRLGSLRKRVCAC